MRNVLVSHRSVGGLPAGLILPAAVFRLAALAKEADLR